MPRPREGSALAPEFVPEIHAQFKVDWCAECVNSCLLWGAWAAHWTAPGADHDDEFLERKMLDFGLNEEDVARAKELEA